MLIIIEGADKNGKTTLAKAIAKNLGYRYVHHGPPTSGAEGYLKELTSIGAPVVMDRSFIGEMVYGNILRAKPCISDQQYYTLLRVASRYGLIVIHARQQPETRDKWYREEKKISAHQNEHAAIRFSVLMERLRRIVPVIDYSCNTRSRLSAFLIAHKSTFATHKSQAETYLDMEPTGYGNIMPTTVFVGEELNKRTTWAGFPFDGGPSANYLDEVLFEHGGYDQKNYYLNARTNNGWTDTRELRWLLHDEPRIVALGSTAHDYLDSFNIQHIKAPHPSFRCRFKRNQRVEYAEILGRKHAPNRDF